MNDNISNEGFQEKSNKDSNQQNPQIQDLQIDKAEKEKTVPLHICEPRFFDDDPAPTESPIINSTKIQDTNRDKAKQDTVTPSANSMPDAPIQPADVPASQTFLNQNQLPTPPAQISEKPSKSLAEAQRETFSVIFSSGQQVAFQDNVNDSNPVVLTYPFPNIVPHQYMVINPLKAGCTRRNSESVERQGYIIEMDCVPIEFQDVWYTTILGTPTLRVFSGNKSDHNIDIMTTLISEDIDSQIVELLKRAFPFADWSCITDRSRMCRTPCAIRHGENGNGNLQEVKALGEKRDLQDYASKLRQATSGVVRTSEKANRMAVGLGNQAYKTLEDFQNGVKKQKYPSIEDVLRDLLICGYTLEKKTWEYRVLQQHPILAPILDTEIEKAGEAITQEAQKQISKVKPPKVQKDTWKGKTFEAMQRQAVKFYQDNGIERIKPDRKTGYYRGFISGKHKHKNGGFCFAETGGWRNFYGGDKGWYTDFLTQELGIDKEEAWKELAKWAGIDPVDKSECWHCDQEIYWKDRVAYNDKDCTEKHKPTCKGKKRQGLVEITDKAKLPIIYLREGYIHKVVDQAEEALLKYDSQNHYLQRTYQRSGFLVRVLTNPHSSKIAGIERPEGAIVIQNIEIPYLIRRFTEAANLLKYDVRLDDWVTKDCPKQVAEVYLASAPWKVPHLAGIIEAPTLRSDGSILDKPGYDEQTGLLFHQGNTEFLPVPEAPTRDDAIKAYLLFADLLKGFSFAEGTGFSVALSGILTALVRRSLRSAPVHSFDAPKAGSGKSLLVDVASLISTGRRATVMSQAEGIEEEKKRLLALLMEGDLIVSIDNVERPLASDSLCSILTQETWKERLLGKNKTVTVPTNVSWFATGNNLIFQGDLSTRAIICRLDPKVEHPEERDFDVNLYEYIPKHRQELVQAGLTILRAYHITGRPKQNIKVYGRFEEWSDWIRSATVWLGLEDPCLSRKRIEAADPISSNLKMLLLNWFECLGSQEITVQKLIENALTGGKEALRSALLEIAGDKVGNLDQRRLGYRLRSYQDRIEGGLKLESFGKGHNNIAQWRVKKVE